MGRTEADRKITSEPRSSSREERQLREWKKKTLLSDRRSLLKKCLTAPTLLEMSGKGVNQELRLTLTEEMRDKMRSHRTEDDSLSLFTVPLVRPPEWRWTRSRRRSSSDRQNRRFGVA